MEKKDIASQIHQQVGISTEEATRLLESILGILKATLQAGESITIAGFGKFTVRNKQARPGRNPNTGETITISARRVVTFRPSHLFKAHVNDPSAGGVEGAA